MHVLALRLLFMTMASLALLACGKSDKKPHFGQKTFVEKGDPSPSIYQVELQEQKFLPSPYQEAKDNNRSLTPNALSKSVEGATYETDIFEIQIGQTKAQFFIDLEKGLKFNEPSHSGQYRINGKCYDYSCENAAFLLYDERKAEVAELIYTRSYEYLTTDSNIQPNQVDQKLIAEAIEFRFPIARHSLKINNGRLTDRLVIELPQVDEFESDDIIITVDSNDKEIAIPNPDKPKRKARQEKRRIVIDASEAIIVHAPRPSLKENKPQPAPLRLTKNPFEAYKEIADPGQLYPSQHIVDASDPSIFALHHAYMPLEKQDALEPTQRIAFFANEFIKQATKFHRHACNHFVRASMALAGYANAQTTPASNSFQSVFRANKDLRTWNSLHYEQPTSDQVQALTKDLSKLKEGHATIYQVDRSRLKTYGHTAILIKENGQYMVYESSLDEYGPQKSPVQPHKLLRARRPNVRIHHHPNTLRP